MAEVLETLSRYPVLRGHADGPCLEKQDMKDLDQALADYREWKQVDDLEWK